MSNPWRSPLDGRYVSKKDAKLAFMLFKAPYFIITKTFSIIVIVFKKR